MPTPPEGFARLRPASADLTDAQLAELGEIERLTDTNVGAAIPAWNAWLAHHGISSPRPPPSGTGTGAGTTAGPAGGAARRVPTGGGSGVVRQRQAPARVRHSAPTPEG